MLRKPWPVMSSLMYAQDAAAPQLTVFSLIGRSRVRTLGNNNLPLPLSVSELLQDRQ